MTTTFRFAGARASGLTALCASILCVLAATAQAAATGPVEGGAVPQPQPLLPLTNWWSTDISKAPVDPKSASYIAFINNGGTRTLHPDFGGDVSAGSVDIYGYPYIVVDGTQPIVAVQFDYSTQSDGVDHTTNVSYPFYPIPTQAITQEHWIECGSPGDVDLRSSCDRHMFILDRDNRYLYELYNVYYDGTQWLAGSGAFFDLKNNKRRPNGWTSADAAGLAMIPGLVRYDEVYNAYGTSVAEIQHAFRVTVRSSNGFVYPGSHNAGSTTGALPMGARLRLKSTTDISSYPAEMQKIFRAMEVYGLIVADNGSDMYISGTYDTNWNNNILNPAFAGLSASDFEVIQLGWRPAVLSALDAVSVAPSPVVGGDTAVGTVKLAAAAPTYGAVVTLTSAGPVSVPATVTIPAGATSATFTVMATAVTANKAARVTANYADVTENASFTVDAP